MKVLWRRQEAASHRGRDTWSRFCCQDSFAERHPQPSCRGKGVPYEAPLSPEQVWQSDHYQYICTNSHMLGGYKNYFSEYKDLDQFIKLSSASEGWRKKKWLDGSSWKTKTGKAQQQWSSWANAQSTDCASPTPCSGLHTNTRPPGCTPGQDSGIWLTMPSSTRLTYRLSGLHAPHEVLNAGHITDSLEPSLHIAPPHC